MLRIWIAIRDNCTFNLLMLAGTTIPLLSETFFFDRLLTIVVSVERFVDLPTR
jgi:hypothetical protein